MNLNLDATEAEFKKGTEAIRAAEQVPPEDIDSSRLMPVFVPTSILAVGWCGPYRRLRNPDIAMTWCVLMEGGVLTYVNHRMQALWEFRGLDWKSVAIRNLAERTKSGEGTTKVLVNRPGGDVRAIKFQQADRLAPPAWSCAAQLRSGFRMAIA